MKNRQALSHCSDHKNPTQCVREISPLIRRGGRSRRRASRDKKKREQFKKKKRGEGCVEVRGYSGEKRPGPSFLTGYTKPELSSEGLTCFTCSELMVRVWRRLNCGRNVWQISDDTNHVCAKLSGDPTHLNTV